MQLNPKEVNALVNRGITFRQSNETDKALADFSEAIRLGHADRRHPAPRQSGRTRPRSRMAAAADQVAHAYYQRGMALIDKQDYEGALNDFNMTMRINPKEPRAYLGRGAANLKKGDRSRR